MNSHYSLARRTLVEGVAAALLVAAVVGSGIMADRLAGPDRAVALLCNTLATAGALVALILAFGGVSGAQMNPAVTLASALRGAQPWRELAPYAAAQIAGGCLGTMLAHAMFALPLVQSATTHRGQPGVFLSEGVATFALLTTIFGCERFAPQRTPFAVAAIIAAGYWFTASTSFANPAVTLARCLSDTYAGIDPGSVPRFLFAQLCGALAAVGLDRIVHGKGDPSS